MSLSDDIYKQIERLSCELLASSLCDDANFPIISRKGNKITEIDICHNEHAVCLKNIPYTEMYNELIKRRQYNFKMIDGALLTLLYRFYDENLIAHRLLFFPAPTLEAFQNEPELYMEDELYVEFTDKRIVTTPLRFDFDSGDAFIPIEHPMSHLTIGQYANCRIPVSSAVTPYQFITFIVRNFYHTALILGRCSFTKCGYKFSSSIVQEEQTLMHVCTPL